MSEKIKKKEKERRKEERQAAALVFDDPPADVSRDAPPPSPPPLCTHSFLSADCQKDFQKAQMAAAAAAQPRLEAFQVAIH